MHRAAQAGHDLRGGAAVGQMPDETSLHFGAGSDAARAKNALVEVDANEWMRIAVGLISGQCGPLLRHCNIVFARPVEQFVVAIVAVGVRHIAAQQQGERQAAQLVDSRRFGLHDHSADDWKFARRQRMIEAVTSNEA